MRLATLLDPVTRSATTVFVLPSGERVGLMDVVHYAPPGASFESFANLAEVAGHLDVVLPAISSWRGTLEQHPPVHAEVEPRYLPPVPQPRTFREFAAFETRHSTPAFSFANTVSVVGHETAIHAPRNAQQLDFTLQIGIVIGRGGKDITPRNAWRHVAGFTIINNFVARDIAAVETSLAIPHAKSRDFATAVGPYLVTLDDLADRIDSTGLIHLKMHARVNGQLIASGNASSMHFSWPQLIEHASRDAELCPGDLLASGTLPGGCILDKSLEQAVAWLKSGDVVELEIERLGILRTPIIDRRTSDDDSKSLGAALAAV
jgi:fumarylacetoacetate (FAA) hydrolase